MRIKLIKYHPLYAYSVGDVFEVNEEHTKYLLEEKYAEAVDSDEPKQVEVKIEDNPPITQDIVENASDKPAELALNAAKENDKKGNQNHQNFKNHKK
jgi:hypothetical protein